MLEKVMRHVKNWFVVPNGIHHGKYVIKNGSISLPFLAKGQYFRIVGSIFNDGVYQYGVNSLSNTEEFYGAIWAMAVPKSFVELVEKIEEWDEQNTAGVYVSESFGGYSYTKATGANGAPHTWKEHFRSELNEWRKL